MFVLELGNGEEGREKEEGRKCFTFFRLFLISSLILPENEISIVYWKCFCDCMSAKGSSIASDIVYIPFWLWCIFPIVFLTLSCPFFFLPLHFSATIISCPSQFCQYSSGACNWWHEHSCINRSGCKLFLSYYKRLYAWGTTVICSSPTYLQLPPLHKFLLFFPSWFPPLPHYLQPFCSNI